MRATVPCTSSHNVALRMQAAELHYSTQVQHLFDWAGPT